MGFDLARLTHWLGQSARVSEFEESIGDRIRVDVVLSCNALHVYLCDSDFYADVAVEDKSVRSCCCCMPSFVWLLHSASQLSSSESLHASSSALSTFARTRVAAADEEDDDEAAEPPSRPRSIIASSFS